VDDKKPVPVEDLMGLFEEVGPAAPAALAPNEDMEIVPGMPRVACQSCGNEYFERYLYDGYCLTCSESRRKAQQVAEPTPEPVPEPVPAALPDLRARLLAVMGARGKLLEATDRMRIANGEMDVFKRAWETKHAAVILALSTAKAELETAESAAREAALEVYEATGDKQPAPGIQIKVFTDRKSVV